MENNSNATKTIAYPVKAAVAGCAAGLLFELFGGAVSLTSLLMPLSAALLCKVLCARPKPLYAALPFVPLVLFPVLFLQGDDLSIAAFALLIPVTSAAVAAMQLRHKGGFWSALVASAVIIALLYVMNFVPPLLRGEGAFADVQMMAKEYADQTRELLDLLKTEAGVTPSENSLLADPERLETLIVEMSTGIVCLLGCAGSLLTVSIFFRCTRKNRQEYGLSVPSPFRRWSIPKSFSGGLLALYAAVLICLFAGVSSYNSVYYTVQLLLSVPLGIQGLAAVLFLVNRRRERRGLSTAIVVICAVFFSISMSLLSSVGMFEQFFRLREKTELLDKLRNQGGAV